jgi:hypothetical protein
MTKRNLLLVGLLLVFGLGVMAPAALAQVTEGNPTIVNVASAVFTLRPNRIGDAGGAIFINFSSGYGTIAGGEVFTVTFSQPIVGAADVGKAGAATTPVGAYFCNDANANGIAGAFCSAMTYSASGNTLTLTNGAAAISGWKAAASGQSYITIWGIRFNTVGVIPGTYITAYVSAAFNQSYPIEFNTSGATQSGIVNVGQVADTAIGGTLSATATPSSVLTCIGFGGGDVDFTVSVAEQWSGAWTSLADETTLAPFAPTSTYTVTNGSQIAIVLTGIPTGVTVTPFAPVVTLGTPVFTGLPTSTTLTNGSQTFVYTLTSTVRQELEAANFEFEAIIPGTGISVNSPPMVASVELYPPPSTTAPVYPAFVYPNGTLIEEPTYPLTVLTFVGCQTNLLWPYVTNYTNGSGPLSNWDTAVEVANTTSDPFGGIDFGGAVPQDGACTFYVYDAATEAVARSSPPTATPISWPGPVVMTGGVYSFMLSTTPAKGVVGGYMIATCNFQNAVGYAGIVDNAGLGTWDAYSNYLAYVIPTPFLVGRVYDAIWGEFAIQPPCVFDDCFDDGVVGGKSLRPSSHNARVPHNMRIVVPGTK